jgi:hypothetical protein
MKCPKCSKHGKEVLTFVFSCAQDIPLHVTMLTFLLIAVDRYRLILDPRKPRLPSFVCAAGTWLLAICIVLPYPIYTTYLDLGVSDVLSIHLKPVVAFLSVC